MSDISSRIGCFKKDNEKLNAGAADKDATLRVAYAVKNIFAGVIDCSLCGATITVDEDGRASFDRGSCFIEDVNKEFTGAPPEMSQSEGGETSQDDEFVIEAYASIRQRLGI